MEHSAIHRRDDDQPLPDRLSRKLAGWASVARQYPIFGKTWFGYRMRSFAAPLGLLAIILALIAIVVPARTGGSKLYVGLAALWLVVALGVSLGRALAVLVCRQQWAAPREVTAVAAALLMGIAVPLSLSPLTHFSPPEQAAGMADAQARDNRVFNLVLWLLVLLWLGGGLDFAAWLRQRRMLRDSALLDELARYKDERNEVELHLSILASQIEPHFLFNTLSGVRAAMLSDPARGVAMIDHLVDYLRATIPQLRSDRNQRFVTLGSQLDAAQAYLGIIEARLPRLQSRIDCPPALRAAAIPPLMLISLVENAVKHGIELKKGPGLIHISASNRQHGGQQLLEVAVADDGIGFGPTTSGSGIGLSNIRERLHHLYGDTASLSLRTGDNGGVVASIVLPLLPLLPATPLQAMPNSAA